MNEATIVTANRLTWAGIVPFLGSAILGAIGVWQDQLAHAFLIYSAVILSFLGGIHWGLVMAGRLENPQGSLIICMFPSLAAWGAVAFLPVLWAIAALGFIYLIWLRYDIRRVNEKWYEQIRQPVTFVVAGSHFLWFITLATELRVG
ncbi:DUF3429 domain-containing protein [Aliidiomarina haloalkalitolerans]|uniref:DUF3429 domain-containing protein n=1 Tax=Aliidiomarina haloalkalitolerans TaxID=859059 RepID=A0A432VQZ5_9GAMM|nr:DUF3429 domain-containing protein [Aliidiomarina haloalkalitolerans]RUO18694.1 DUF3429 domain-containing protein [Aliidiomarina haloalkalitolerans]